LHLLDFIVCAFFQWVFVTYQYEATFQTLAFRKKTNLKIAKKYSTSGLQVSISSTFYEQLLRTQIQKAQKDSQVVNLFLRFWGLRMQKLLEEH